MAISRPRRQTTGAAWERIIAYGRCSLLSRKQAVWRSRPPLRGKLRPMGQKRRAGKELWILGGLLLLFVILVPYLIQSGQESAPLDMPSASSSRKVGVKGCYLWLEQEGFSVEKLKTTW